jgi:hypothetical protein
MDPAHNNRDRPDVPPPRFAEARSLDASPCAASRAPWSLTGEASDGIHKKTKRNSMTKKNKKPNQRIRLC